VVVVVLTAQFVQTGRKGEDIVRGVVDGAARRVLSCALGVRGGGRHPYLSQ